MRPASRRCSTAFASSAASQSCSAPFRSTCSRCCSAARRRCCRSTRATSCTPGRGDSACCARPRPSARSAWRCGSRTIRCGAPRRAPDVRRSGGVRRGDDRLRRVAARSSLSLLALTVLGASDMISVVVRQTLVQLQTPDHMRGRVSAVNSLFIGTSNQLGEFESGVAAAWLGVVPSVVLGGVGTSSSCSRGCGSFHRS